MTYDGAALRVYRNGAQAAAVARTGAIQTSTGALRIGGNLIWGEYPTGASTRCGSTTGPCRRARSPPT